MVNNFDEKKSDFNLRFIILPKGIYQSIYLSFYDFVFVCPSLSRKYMYT